MYYTPEWVTAYIVEETLGRILAEIRASILTDEFAAIDGAQIHADHTRTGKFRNKDVLSARYFAALESYEQRLAKIKVLDPACGSGAFLIQALKRFVAEYEWIAAEKSRVSYAAKQAGLFDRARAYRDILGHNLYGVDINAESVEITKLALWLHTALPGQPLSSLDAHIVCGNSLVDWDIETVLGPLTEEQKQRINPFSYASAFPEVFAAGGFDVIIGNARLIPRVNLAVSETGGEIALHADSVVVLSVIETEQDAPLIAAQWRQVLRTTSITPSLTAQKLLDRLLALRTTENTALRQRIIDSDTKLEQQKAAVTKKESEINQLIYGLYGLADDEIKRVGQG